MRQHRGLLGKVRWHLNAQATRRPWALNACAATLTIVDAYGSPGDTLLTAIICRDLRRRFPRLRLNCVTPNADLLRHDPNIDSLNAPETFFSVWSWYPDTIGRRDGDTNVLRETFGRLGLGRAKYEYRARVYLTDEERIRGRELLGDVVKPVLTFHTRTRNDVKEWPLNRWLAVLSAWRPHFHVVHLGDTREPLIDDVHRLAGRLTLRESMSVLAHARVHVGADSFLMHAANGLDIPSVIIFGGSRTPANLGYQGNANLFTPMTCGPCWLHTINGEHCVHDIACMDQIAPADVIAAVGRLAPDVSL
jgi:ADP-heptose:LPS heptosyltransferase